MPTLRFLAAVAASALLALGLSVGAALAEEQHTAAPAAKTATQKGAHWAPSGVCLLDPAKTR